MRRLTVEGTVVDIFDAIGDESLGRRRQCFHHGDPRNAQLSGARESISCFSNGSPKIQFGIAVDGFDDPGRSADGVLGVVAHLAVTSDPIP